MNVESLRVFLIKFLEAIIMWPAFCFVPFKIWICHILKKLIRNDVKSCFLHFHILTMEKALYLTAEDFAFDPTIYIPHIGQW